MAGRSFFRARIVRKNIRTTRFQNENVFYRRRPSLINTCTAPLAERFEYRKS